MYDDAFENTYDGPILLDSQLLELVDCGTVRPLSDYLPLELPRVVNIYRVSLGTSSQDLAARDQALYVYRQCDPTRV